MTNTDRVRQNYDDVAGSGVGYPECTECGAAATWEISWSPTRLNVHSCDEHLAGMCRTYAVRRVKERPQDGPPYLILTATDRGIIGDRH